MFHHDYFVVLNRANCSGSCTWSYKECSPCVIPPNFAEEAHVVSEFQYPLHHRLFALFFAETNWFPATQSPPLISEAIHIWRPDIFLAVRVFSYLSAHSHNLPQPYWVFLPPSLDVICASALISGQLIGPDMNRRPLRVQKWEKVAFYACGITWIIRATIDDNYDTLLRHAPRANRVICQARIGCKSLLSLKLEWDGGGGGLAAWLLHCTYTMHEWTSFKSHVSSGLESGVQSAKSTIAFVEGVIV